MRELPDGGLALDALEEARLTHALASLPLDELEGVARSLAGLVHMLRVERDAPQAAETLLGFIERSATRLELSASPHRARGFRTLRSIVPALLAKPGASPVRE